MFRALCFAMFALYSHFYHSDELWKYAFGFSREKNKDHSEDASFDPKIDIYYISWFEGVRNDCIQRHILKDGPFDRNVNSHMKIGYEHFYQ